MDYFRRKKKEEEESREKGKKKKGTLPRSYAHVFESTAKKKGKFPSRLGVKWAEFLESFFFLFYVKLGKKDSALHP